MWVPSAPGDLAGDPSGHLLAHRVPEGLTRLIVNSRYFSIILADSICYCIVQIMVVLLLFREIGNLDAQKLLVKVLERFCRFFDVPFPCLLLGLIFVLVRFLLL